MPLRGKPPETIEKRLKLFLFGDAGSGKTTAAIGFPSCYLLDCERGAENDQYVKLLKASGGHHYQCSDLDDALVEVAALLTEKHAFRTLIIDPITTLYNDACDKAARELADPKAGTDGTEFGRHKGRADRKMKRLVGLLIQLDMNVILTSHAKTKWGKDDKGQFREEGRTFDAYNKLDYLFDLVLDVQLRGVEPWARVCKTRLSGFPMLDCFPMGYDVIADRYGRAVLERGAEPVRLATDEQVARLASLALNVRLSDKEENAEVIQKWLDKAHAESFAGLPYDVAEKCIAFAESRVSPSAATAA